MFVAGGTAGNLSALLAARWRLAPTRRRSPRPHPRPAAGVGRGPLLGGPGGAGDGCRRGGRPGRRPRPADRRRAAGDRRRPRRRRPRPPVRRRRDERHDQRRGHRRPRRGRPRCSAELGTWLHVDGAYGGAAPRWRRACATASPASRPPTASSSTRTSGCSPRSTRCALLYRDPQLGRAAHTQHAEYLDVLHADHSEADPSARVERLSDYAHHLTRRARGLPLWFSLATHGTDAYRDAVETTLRRRPRAAPTSCAHAPHLELIMEPELSRRAVPPARLGAPPTTRRGATGSWRAAGVRHADARGATRPSCVVHRQPADHRRGPGVDRRAASPMADAASADPADLVVAGARLRGHDGRRPTRARRRLGRHHRRPRLGRRRPAAPPPAERGRSTPTDCLVTPGPRQHPPPPVPEPDPGLSRR